MRNQGVNEYYFQKNELKTSFKSFEVVELAKCSLPNKIFKFIIIFFSKFILTTSGRAVCQWKSDIDNFLVRNRWRVKRKKPHTVKLPLLTDFEETSPSFSKKLPESPPGLWMLLNGHLEWDASILEWNPLFKGSSVIWTFDCMEKPTIIYRSS